jgi:hypothetical protein
MARPCFADNFEPYGLNFIAIPIGITVGRLALSGSGKPEKMATSYCTV